MTIVLALVGLRIWLGLTALGLFSITLVAATVATQTDHKMSAAKQAGISGLVSMRSLRRDYQFAAVAFFSSLSASVIVIAALVVVR
jgi:cytochrome c-type biogenesis protein CcmE